MTYVLTMTVISAWVGLNIAGLLGALIITFSPIIINERKGE